MSNFVRISILLLSSFIFFSTSFCFPVSVLAADQGDTYEPDDSYAESYFIDKLDLSAGDFVELPDHTFHRYFDEDWIKFVAKKDLTYDITADVKDPNSEADPIIELYSSDGTTLLKRVNSSGPGGSEFLQWVGPEATSVFFVRIINDSIHYGSSVTYDISFLAQKILSLPGYLKGKVTDKSNNAPIQGAIIKASNGVGTSQSNGDYVIGLNVESGTVKVNFRRDGYVSKEITLTDFEEGASRTEDVELEQITSNKPPTITGTPKTDIYVNSLYSFQPTASDPEGDSFFFSIANKPSWLSFNPDNGMVLGIPTESHIGKHGPITITVQDSQGGVSNLSSFMVEVKDVVFSPGILILLMK